MEHTLEFKSTPLLPQAKYGSRKFREKKKEEECARLSKFVMDPSTAIDLIKELALVVHSFIVADKAFSQVLRDLPPLLDRCKELTENIKSLKINNMTSSETLRQFGEELTASTTLLNKWQAKLSSTGDFRVLNILRSKARLSRLQDMIMSIRTYREELMQIVQVEQTRIAQSAQQLQAQGTDAQLRLLSSFRKGTFRNYSIVINDKARQY